MLEHESVQKRYKYIHLVRSGEAHGRAVWSCRNNKTGDELGEVKWYTHWRTWCYFPSTQAVYSAGCLRDIAQFMDHLVKIQGAKARAKAPNIKEGWRSC